MKTVEISIVIPIFKCEECLVELYSRLVGALECITKNFEIILIEDCGEDNSWQIIEHLSSSDKRIRGYQLSRNFGQHYAITAGLDFSRGNWVVIMDGDLQDRPEEIPKLYAKAIEGFDIVLALRGRRKDSYLKRIYSWGFYRVFSYLSDMKYVGDSGNFRIMSRNVVNNFCQLREQLRFLGALVQWMGFKTTAIEVIHSERAKGVSSYTFLKLWNLASDVIVAYSDKPLRISIKLGFLMAAGSFGYGIYFLSYALINGIVVQGWTSLIVALFFIGGIIISILGIIGLYLGKTFDESKKRPLYIVARKSHNEDG